MSRCKTGQSLYLQKSHFLCVHRWGAEAVYTPKVNCSVYRNQQILAQDTWSSSKKGGGSQLYGKINIYLLQLGALWMSHGGGCEGIELAAAQSGERTGGSGALGEKDKEQLIHLINSAWLWDARTHTKYPAECALLGSDARTPSAVVLTATHFNMPLGEIFLYEFTNQVD